MSKAGRARYFAQQEKDGREQRARHSELLRTFSTSTQRPGVSSSLTKSAVHPASRIAARHDREGAITPPIVVSPLSPKAERVIDYLKSWRVVKLEGLARSHSLGDVEAAETLCRRIGVRLFTRAGALWCQGGGLAPQGPRGRDE